MYILQSEGLVCAIRYHGFLVQTTLMLTSDEGCSGANISEDLKEGLR